MTTTLRTNDGVYLTALTPAALVHELHKMSLSPAPTDAEFMHRMAARVALTSGKKISARSPEEFIRCLIAAGALIEED